MLNLYPDDYGFSGMEHFYNDPWSRQQQLRRAQLQRQAAMEEERRQRALYDRALREEQMRREEMRRREMANQKRREEQLRQRVEMLRRQSLEQSRREAEQRRRILERQWQQQRRKELELESQLELERVEREREQREQEKLLGSAEYGIVRGPDGRLYRLNSDDGYGHDTSFSGSGPRLRGLSQRRTSSTMSRRMRPVRDFEARGMSTTDESESDTDVPSGVSTKKENKTPNLGPSKTMKASIMVEIKKSGKSAGKKSKAGPKAKPKSSVLIGEVEDASDSEQEDFTSVWRNRLPSEGEWMEPVKGYDVYW